MVTQERWLAKLDWGLQLLQPIPLGTDCCFGWAGSAVEQSYACHVSSHVNLNTLARFRIAPFRPIVLPLSMPLDLRCACLAWTGCAALHRPRWIFAGCTRRGSTKNRCMLGCVDKESAMGRSCTLSPDEIPPPLPLRTRKVANFSRRQLSHTQCPAPLCCTLSFPWWHGLKVSAPRVHRTGPAKRKLLLSPTARSLHWRGIRFL